MLWIVACGEAPQPTTPPTAPSAEPQRASIRQAVSQYTGMPPAAAQALSVAMMPNGTMATTMDPTSRLCFVAALSDAQWSVVFAGTQPPPGLLHALPVQTMGQQVDAEAAARWVAERCGQP